MTTAASAPTTIDRFIGCLVGGAVGDALGYPVEFSSYEGICARFGAAGIRAYELDPWAGQALFSDDTQMTLFTAVGLTRAGAAASREDAARAVYHAYLDWLHTQDRSCARRADACWLLDEPQLYSRRAPGNTCLSALRSGQMGTMDHALNDSCGCGGVMRVAPMGLFFANSTTAALAAADAAAITHSHPMGYVPAAALAFIVNRCVWGPGSSLEEIVDACCAELPSWFDAERDYAQGMADQLQYARELAAGDAPDAQNVPLLGAGWVGDEALAIAVYAALRHADDFGEAVIAAVNHSGDADSTGAIAGNIVGARLGAAGIASAWTDPLELREVIARVAHELYDAMGA